MDQPEIRKCRECGYEGYAILDFGIKSQPHLCKKCKTKRSKASNERNYGKPSGFKRGAFNKGY
jgi:hypothetical protein